MKKNIVSVLDFGSKTGIELEESEGTIAGENAQEWYLGDTLSAAIGQSYNSYTPLQLVNYVAAIANGGKLMKPYLVDSVTNYTGTIIDKNKNTKLKNILVFKPNINVSVDNYVIKNNALLLPLNSIHNVGGAAVSEIIKERQENGKFIDFYQFVARTYGKSVNKKTIESLIDADCFRDFNVNHKSLMANIDSALDYAMLCSDLDESLVMKPNLLIEEEYNDGELMSRELSTFGFYVTNHPASKYQDGIMKIENIKKFFDKYVNCVVIIGNVRKIKTKTGDDMGFISGSDETGTCDLVIFPRNNKYLNKAKNKTSQNYRNLLPEKILHRMLF